MDLSALEKAVKAFETSLDSVEFWITVSTVLVVIGLVVEYWFPLLELIESIRRRPPFPWTLVMEMAGGVLVTFGVAGELWFQSRASSLQTFIRTDAHQIEALLNKEASEASERAGNADRRAEELQVEAGKLRIAIADRDLNVGQQLKIKKSLAKFKGSGVWIRSYPNDGEAARLILELKAALEPEIHVEDRTGQLMGQSAPSSPVLGIAIEPSRDRHFAEALVNSFRNDGMLSIADLTPFGSGLEETEILVGLKPVALAQVTANIARTAKQSSTPPRVLTPRQQADIAGKLGNLEALKGITVRVNLLRYPDDPDAEALAAQIEAALHAAGGGQWMVSEAIGKEPSRSVVGIEVNWLSDGPNNMDLWPRTFADCQLTSALNANGLAANGCNFGRPTDEMIVSGHTDPNALIKIVVGRKP